MQVRAIKTHKIKPWESLEDILDRYVMNLVDGEIVAITSKIVSICHGDFVDKSTISKYDLIKREADIIYDPNQNQHDLYLTLKCGVLIPSAGIDESNATGIYVLYPKNVQRIAASIWQHLRKKHAIQKLGVIITDSNPVIARRGVCGITLGWCGFAPLHSYVNKPDIYGNILRVTQINVLDAIGTSAVFVMGEGDEQTPLAIIQAAPKIAFLERPPTLEEERSVVIPFEEDLYAPLLVSAKLKL